ncbi:translation initiation factor IF-5A [Candidatus Woesearchaeota archaeon]|nr:translation initiation factor IF-5A [Candidatus Woesearchaeota archaeon]
MAGTKLVHVSSLKKGSNIVLEGEPCIIKNTQTSRPGKHGHAKTRIEAVGMFDNRKRQIVMPGHDNIEVPIIEKNNAQVLSVQGDFANVMDNESYETFDLKIPKELQGKVASGVNILYWEILDKRIMKQVR